MREQRYHGLRKGFLALIAGGLVLWWRWRPFRVAVEGASMSPTLEPGEHLVAVRAGAVRGDSLVVVEHPTRPGYEVVKRVAAVPGGRAGHRILGPGEYWVTGDNPIASTDSRTFGPIGEDAVRGRVVLRYWPIRRMAWFG
jgi:nickel-type superoxide dismutase maturation protease